MASLALSRFKYKIQNKNLWIKRQKSTEHQCAGEHKSINEQFIWIACLFVLLLDPHSNNSINYNNMVRNALMKYASNWAFFPLTMLTDIKTYYLFIIKFLIVPESKWCNGTLHCCKPIIMTLKYFGTVLLIARANNLFLFACLLLFISCRAGGGSDEHRWQPSRSEVSSDWRPKQLHPPVCQHP